MNGLPVPFSRLVIHAFVLEILIFFKHQFPLIWVCFEVSFSETFFKWNRCGESWQPIIFRPNIFFPKNKYNFYKPFSLSLSKIFKKLLGWVRSYGGTFFFFGPRLPNCPELDIFWKNQSCNFGAPLHLFACAKLKKHLQQIQSYNSTV